MGRPGTSAGQQGAGGRVPLGLDEELGEGRVCGVRIGGEQDRLQVARKLDAPGTTRAVLDPQPAPLQIQLRINGQLQLSRDPRILPLEQEAAVRAFGAVALGGGAGGLVAQGPEVAGLQVPQIDERSPGRPGLGRPGTG